MIHILHPQTGSIMGYLDNNGDNLFWHDLHEHHVDGFNTFRFTMNSQTPTSVNVEGRSRIIIPSERKGYQEFIIHDVAVIDGDKEVFSTGAETELDKQKIIVPTTHKELTLKQYVELAVGDTEYQMGEVIFSGTKTISFDKHVGAYTFLLQVAKEFGVELSFRVEVSGNTIIGRYADLLSDDGIFSGKEIEYGKDLISIKKETFSDRIITSLLCLGPIKTDGTRLSATVTDNDAFQRWGRDGKHIVGVYETTNTNVRMTLAQLTAEGKIELKKRIDSTDEFTVDAATIETIFPNEKTFLGDKVRVKNLQYQPPLYAEARILKVQRSLSDKSAKKFLVGNVLTYDVTQIKLPTPINDGCDPPTNPKEGQLWINTCEEPAMMKKWSCVTGPTDCSNISPSQRDFLNTYTGGDFTLVNTPGCIGMFGFKMVKEPLSVSFQWQINIYAPSNFPVEQGGLKSNVTSEPYEEYGGLPIVPVEIEKIEVLDYTSSGQGYNLRIYCNFTEGGVLQQAAPLFFATDAWLNTVKALPDQFPSLVCNWKTVGSTPAANSTTAPVAPTNKDLWFDTSTTVPVLKQYDGASTTWKTMVATKLSELTGELPGSRITDGTIPIAKLVPNSIVTGIKKFGSTDPAITGVVEFEAGTGITISQDNTTKKLVITNTGGGEGGGTEPVTLYENFESDPLFATGTWYTTAEDAYAGTKSLRPPAIGTSQSTEFLYTFEIATSGSVSFFYKTDSESTTYDYFTFWIDDVQMLKIGGVQTVYSQYTSDLTAGVHTIKFKYQKDGSGNIGRDTVFIDEFKIVDIIIPEGSILENANAIKIRTIPIDKPTIIDTIPVFNGTDIVWQAPTGGGGTSGDATTIQGVPVPAPIATDDEKLLAYDNETLSFKYVTPSTGTGGTDATSIHGKNIPAPTVTEDEMVLAYDNDTGAMKWIVPPAGGGTGGSGSSGMELIAFEDLGTGTDVTSVPQGLVANLKPLSFTLLEQSKIVIECSLYLYGSSATDACMVVSPDDGITWWYYVEPTDPLYNLPLGHVGQRMRVSHTTYRTGIMGFAYGLFEPGTYSVGLYHNDTDNLYVPGSNQIFKIMAQSTTASGGGGGTAGVSSIKSAGGNPLVGDVELIGGTGVTFTQDDTLKQITINSSPTASGDAISIQGIPVDATSITDGYVLTYDAATGSLILKPKPSGGGETYQVLSFTSQVVPLVINLTLTPYKNPVI